MHLIDHIQSQAVHQVTMAQAGEPVLQCYRESTPASASTLWPMVLLHGIGSGAASWIYQLDAIDFCENPQARTRVLAWDAPGYGDSTAVAASEPAAQDYAMRLWAWLDALQLTKVHLVGHSLGAVMAASAARLQPQRVVALTLLAPAQGYARAPQDVRTQKRGERLNMLAELGVEKMAQTRGPALLAPQADPEHLALAVHTMSQLKPSGYTQATHMLSGADIVADLHAFRAASAAPITVACGEADTITPAKGARALADAIHAPFVSLGDVGHLCAVQASCAVNTLLMNTNKKVEAR